MIGQPSPNPTGSNIRVFVIDDHPVVRYGLQTMIDSAGDLRVTGTAASADEAMKAKKLFEADVILVDLRMPGMDGFAFIRAILKMKSSLRIAVVTNYHSDEDVFRAFEAGAMAYMLKTSSDQELFAAIRRIYAGSQFVPEEIARQLSERAGRVQLSVRELEILEYVAHGLTNKEIAEVLYISDKTVRNHVINILDKLGAKDRTEATAIAMDRGLIQRSPSK